MSMTSASARLRLHATRLKHRAMDCATLFAFSLIPFSAVSTDLIVGKSGLSILQWPGGKVGSGGYVWNGARRLARHFQLHGDGCAVGPHAGAVAVAGRPWRDLSLLELGSGTGAAGLAASVLGADVTLTDQASFCYPGAADGTNRMPSDASASTLLDLMRTNATDNGAMLLGQKPFVSELLWGNAEHMLSLPPVPKRSEDGYNLYDVICGADILLFTSAHEDMIRSFRRLSGPSTVVIIEHTDRSSDTEDYPPDLKLFFRLVAEDGLWSPSVVQDHGRCITIRMVRRSEGDEPFCGALPRLRT